MAALAIIGISLILILTLLSAVLSEHSRIATKNRVTISSGMPDYMSKEIIAAAIDNETKYRVPASITLAQIIYYSEGDYQDEMSFLAYEHHNLFKRKGKGPNGSVIIEELRYDEEGEPYYVSVRYRTYHNIYEAIDEQCKLLVKGSNGRATRKCTTPHQWAETLERLGLSEDEGYADDLISIIEKYNLMIYDSGGRFAIGDGMTTGQLRWPTVKSAVITSYFGHRESPTAGATTYHKGVDFGVYGNKPGSAIYAADGGKVLAAGYNVRMGNYVKIQHDGMETVYMHMQHGSLTVRKGQKVTKGQRIGSMGTTGVSTGVHLHFELWINGIAVDPLDYISKEN